jgi:GDPmannose 4,6-dehydratase
MKILSIDEAKQFSSNKVVVIITGVTGQDGSLMADYLIKNTDYEIFGGARRLSVSNHENISHLEPESRFHLINFDLTDAHSISQIICQLKPSCFINFAAQSFVKSSWDFPVQTWETNTTSIIHILESIRLHCPSCRFYNAGSSEEFGDVEYTPQDEKHPMRPCSPYGASKAAARQLVRVYRESYGLYAIQGWLFNHEGTRRGEEFVTRKITKAVAKIQKQIRLKQPITPFELGNLNAKRDWSDAEDSVRAVWCMLNQDKYNPALKEKMHDEFPELYSNDLKNLEETQWLSKNINEYVVSSGENHTVREFVEEAFTEAGIQGKWCITDNDPMSERYVLRNADGTTDGYGLVTVNPAFYRPAEVNCLLGNNTLIINELGWTPIISFKVLVRKMVEQDIDIENS